MQLSHYCIALSFVFTLLISDSSRAAWGDFDNPDVWPARCQVQFMHKNTGLVYPGKERRVCSFGVRFANDQGTYIDKTFACVIEPGEKKCEMMLRRDELNILPEWYPQDAWTERDMMQSEVGQGCVYMKPYPTAYAMIVEDTMTSDGLKDFLEVRVIKRLSCALGNP